MKDPKETKESDKGQGAEGGSGEAKGDAKKGELSKEEQMAQFEEDLKESDWGHQPC